MSAKHALLGLLLDRSAYPYQLASRLQERLGPAWDVNSGQLYQTVKAMEKEGLIERVHDASAERDDRHVFSITEAGVSEFERFFEQSPEPVRLYRRPLLVKITFAGPEHLEQALAKIDAYEAECATRLSQIARLREEVPADGPLLRADHLLLRLNLSADVFQLEGELRWARHAREMLSWLSSRGAVWPSGRGRGDAEHESERDAARRDLFGRMAGSEPSGPSGTRPARGGDRRRGDGDSQGSGGPRRAGK